MGQAEYFAGLDEPLGDWMKVARAVTAGLVCALVLALAAPALASSPATSAYGGACSTQSVCSGTTLPFTGINDAGVAAIGVALIAAGFVVRRKLRPARD